jgi:hypothetical protein
VRPNRDGQVVCRHGSQRRDRQGHRAHSRRACTRGAARARGDWAGGRGHRLNSTRHPATWRWQAARRRSCRSTWPTPCRSTWPRTGGNHSGADRRVRERGLPRRFRRCVSGRAGRCSRTCASARPLDAGIPPDPGCAPPDSGRLLGAAPSAAGTEWALGSTPCTPSPCSCWPRRIIVAAARHYSMPPRQSLSRVASDDDDRVLARRLTGRGCEGVQRFGQPAALVGGHSPQHAADRLSAV